MAYLSHVKAVTHRIKRIRVTPNYSRFIYIFILRDREINHCNSRKILKSRQNKFELSHSLAQLSPLLFSNVRPSSEFNYLLWCYWFLGEHISDTNSFYVIMSGLLSWQQLLIKAVLKPANKETTRR